MLKECESVKMTKKKAEYKCWQYVQGLVSFVIRGSPINNLKLCHLQINLTKNS